MHKQNLAFIFVLVAALFLVVFSGCVTPSNGVCGDNICSASETSLSCPSDCGKSPDQNSPGTIGGGKPAGILAYDGSCLGNPAYFDGNTNNPITCVGYGSKECNAIAGCTWTGFATASSIEKCFIKITVDENKSGLNNSVILTYVDAVPVYGDYSSFVKNFDENLYQDFKIEVWDDYAQHKIGEYGFYSGRYSFWDDVDQNGKPIGGIDEVLYAREEIIIPRSLEGNSAVIKVFSVLEDENANMLLSLMSEFDLPSKTKYCTKNCGEQGQIISLPEQECCEGHYPKMDEDIGAWVCTIGNGLNAVEGESA